MHHEEFELISDPLHFYFLSLIETEDFVFEMKWIAKRLGVSVIEAQQIVERLKKIKLIEVSKDGQVFRKVPHWRTSDGVQNLALRKAHRTQLQTTLDQFEQINLELRDLSSMVMAIDLRMHMTPPTCRVRLERIQVDNIRQGEFAGVMCIGRAIDLKKLPQAKEKIKRFRRELCKYLESGKKQEVYSLCIQLIPRSLPSKSKKNEMDPRFFSIVCFLHSPLCPWRRWVWKRRLCHSESFDKLH